jgi:hypothetical protein
LNTEFETEWRSTIISIQFLLRRQQIHNSKFSSTEPSPVEEGEFVTQSTERQDLPQEEGRRVPSEGFRELPNGLRDQPRDFDPQSISFFNQDVTIHHSDCMQQSDDSHKHAEGTYHQPRSSGFQEDESRVSGTTDLNEGLRQQEVTIHEVDVTQQPDDSQEHVQDIRHESVGSSFDEDRYQAEGSTNVNEVTTKQSDDSEEHLEGLHRRVERWEHHCRSAGISEIHVELREEAEVTFDQSDGILQPDTKRHLDQPGCSHDEGAHGQHIGTRQLKKDPRKQKDVSFQHTNPTQHFHYFLRQEKPQVQRPATTPDNETPHGLTKPAESLDMYVERIAASCFEIQHTCENIAEETTRVLFVFRKIASTCPSHKEKWYKLASRYMKFAAFSLDIVIASEKVGYLIMTSTTELLRLMHPVYDLMTTTKNMVYVCQQLLIESKRFYLKYVRNTYNRRTDDDRETKENIGKEFETVCLKLCEIRNNLRSSGEKLQRLSRKVLSETPPEQSDEVLLQSRCFFTIRQQLLTVCRSMRSLIQ